MTPNKNDMILHLRQLFEWAAEALPLARFEMRCLDPLQPAEGGRKAEHRQFALASIVEAADWSCEKNQQAYNCYVTANLIAPRAPDRAKGMACDSDMLTAIHQFIDADGITATDFLDSGFPVSMMVVTGTVPLVRAHIYYRYAEPVFDLDGQWRATQSGLAERHGTDKVINPARIVRLAGSISYPSTQKRVERGHEIELTQINVTGDEVDDTAFVAAFPAPVTVREAVGVYDVEDDAGGSIPVCVVSAALTAIPPMMHGQRTLWISICHACIAANPGSRHEFEMWQMRGVPHHGSASIWMQLIRKGGSTGYPVLFKLASENDPHWWRDNAEVESWWKNRPAKRSSQEMNNESIKGQEVRQMGSVVELFPRRPPVDIAERTVYSKEQAEEAVKQQRLAATARLREKKRWELSHSPRRRG